MPHGKTHMEPWINVVNMEKKWAVIPGDDGNVKASFITSQDMSRFLARLMDLDEWNKVSAIRANTLSFNELVEIGEKARGKPAGHTPRSRCSRYVGCKFQVVHDSLEKLQSGKISFYEDFPPVGLGEGDQALFATIHYQAAIGRYLVPREYPPLDEVFPDLKVTTPLEVIETAWKGK